MTIVNEMRIDAWSHAHLLSALRDHAVSSASLLPDGRVAAVDAVGDPHAVALLPAQVPTLLDRLADAGVDVALVPPSPWAIVLRELVQALPFLILLYLVVTSMQPMLARMNPGGATTYDAADPEDLDVTFADVAGMASAKEELFEVVESLRDPQRFARSGARAPRGVLLEGPPGTGKTLLARAVAGEANASFLAITASSLVEMYVGVGAARVRALFARATELAPCIVWIDEIDAVARQRSSSGARGGGGNEERETTLNELLSAMDGFDGDRGIVVLAATNRADVLDEALLRPGRFDRRVAVALPDARERADILRVHARGKTLADDVDLDVVARTTPGMSGAQLENLLNEAAIRALRRNDTVLVAADVAGALERVTLGLARDGSGRPRDVRERVAVHETGHALVGDALDDFDAVDRVSIVPRGAGVGGVTSFVPRGEDDLPTRAYLRAELAVLLAGRAAEALVLGEETVSVGASSDLARARSLAERMVVEWAMGGSLRGAGSDRVAERTLQKIDADVEELLDDAYTRAVGVLNERRGALHEVVRALLDRETLTASELVALLNASS